MPSRYDLVVFDWDCTLMNSAARIVRCLQRAADDIGQPVPKAAAIQNIIGLGLPEAFRRLFGAISEAVSIELTTAYRRHWQDPQVAASALFSGAQAMLERLQSEGYRLAIATGKGRQGLDQVLQETCLAAYFAATRCADECHSKPHPQMLQEILIDLDTQPERALVIGDTTYDMQMAVLAGVDAAGVAHGVHTATDLQAAGARVVFAELSEIPDWLRTVA